MVGVHLLIKDNKRWPFINSRLKINESPDFKTNLNRNRDFIKNFNKIFEMRVHTCIETRVSMRVHTSTHT